MTKEIKSTVEEFIESLNVSERKQFDAEYKEFLLSEMNFAAMEKSDTLVRKLAETIGLSAEGDIPLSNKK